MARREFARIGTDMPDEPSIRALTVEEQWLYDHALYLRPEMSRCGVIPHRPALWADLATNATDAKVRKWLAGLAKARVVVVDEKYSEVLLRTYVRHDGLLTQPNVVAAMVSDYRVIASPLIRRAFLNELRRLWDLPDLSTAARGGWLLAMGAYPAPKETQRDTWPTHIDGATRARLHKSIGRGLAPDMTEAVNEGHVPTFTEHTPGGFPEPFTEGPRAGAIAVSAVSGSLLLSPSAERRTPGPPGRGSDLAGPAADGEHTHTAAQLLDATGPYVAKVRAGLHDQAVACLAAGAPPDAIHRALTVWRTRKAGPGLLTHLVQDQLTPAAAADPRFAGLLADAQASR